MPGGCGPRALWSQPEGLVLGCQLRAEAAGLVGEQRARRQAPGAPGGCVAPVGVAASQRGAAGAGALDALSWVVPAGRAREKAGGRVLAQLPGGQRCGELALAGRSRSPYVRACDGLFKMCLCWFRRGRERSRIEASMGRAPCTPLRGHGAHKPGRSPGRERGQRSATAQAAGALDAGATPGLRLRGSGIGRPQARGARLVPRHQSCCCSFTPGARIGSASACARRVRHAAAPWSAGAARRVLRATPDRDRDPAGRTDPT